LTDTQLMHMCKKLKIKCHGCYVKDELKSLSNGNYFINLNGQSHWTAIVKKGDQVLYFDSYGFPAPEEIENLIEGNYLYNQSEIQGLQQTSCGFYCLAFMKYMKNKDDLSKAFTNFLNLFGPTKEKNEQTIRKILNS
jgi:hypothetical protein